MRHIVCVFLSLFAYLTFIEGIGPYGSLFEKAMKAKPLDLNGLGKILDKEFDKGLPKIREYIAKNKFDPMELPSRAVKLTKAGKKQVKTGTKPGKKGDKSGNKVKKPERRFIKSGIKNKKPEKRIGQPIINGTNSEKDQIISRKGKRPENKLVRKGNKPENKSKQPEKKGKKSEKKSNKSEKKGKKPDKKGKKPGKKGPTPEKKLSVSLSKGILKGVKSVRRNGNMQVKYKDRVFDVTLPIVFDKVMFEYNYKALLMSGRAKGSYEKFALKLNLKVDYRAKKLTVAIKPEKSSGKFSVNFGDNGNLILKLFGSMVQKKIKERIFEECETTGTKLANDMLKKGSKMIKAELGF